MSQEFTRLSENLLPAISQTKCVEYNHCAFCGVKVDRWEEGHDALKEYQGWNPSCEFAKGLFAANIPIFNDQPQKLFEKPKSNYDVYGPHMQCRPNSRPQRCNYIFTFIYFCVKLQQYTNICFYSYTF